MTERLYYDNALLTEFDGHVTRSVKTDSGWNICLDRSAFYPESGGQPGDTGYFILGDGQSVRILDTQCDEKGEVWHLCAQALEEGQGVHGKIDWERRRDHMEQHGGEHLLAGAVWRILRGTTIGLHTGREDATIDVTMPDGRCHLTEAEIERLETEVNTQIRMDVPVRCWFPGEEELAALPLRKPPTVREHVRVVAYGDFEYCACGGTHPPRSGMIGQIKILSVFPSKGKARFRFVCGQRAEAFLGGAYRIGKQCAEKLSCALEDLPGTLDKLAAETAALKKQLEKQNRLLADQWIRASEQNRVVLGTGTEACFLEIPWMDRQVPIDCVSRMIRTGNRIVLCVSDQAEDISFVLASSQDVPLSLNELIRKVPGIRGGGRAHLVQGKIADRAAVRALFDMLMPPGSACQGMH